MTGREQWCTYPRSKKDCESATGRLIFHVLIEIIFMDKKKSMMIVFYLYLGLGLYILLCEINYS